MTEHIQTLIVVIVLGLVGQHGFLTIVGGESLAKRVLRFESKLLRGAIGYPVIWIGQFIHWLGKNIRG